MNIDDKLARLKEILKAAGSALVAFSGGVDSTLLARVAFDVLADKALAVTIKSEIHPSFEEADARELAAAIGIRHMVIEVSALSVAGLAENPPERCYICKKSILGRLLEIAREEGLAVVVEGTNASDAGDFRPGARAVAELGVKSPLKEAGLTKDEIRALSQRLGLATWQKPSLACLASRIPYGERITLEKLKSIDAAEDLLRAAGYNILRVRRHGDLARIELGAQDMKRFLTDEKAADIAAGIKALGFAYVTLDLQGYRTGSLNETLAGTRGSKESPQ